MAISITRKDLKEYLETFLERKPTEDELNRFLEYVEDDIGTWLNENARCFVRDKIQ